MSNDAETKRPLRALIIDDEYDICFLLSRILKSKNLDVQFANSIGEGKDYLSKLNPDVLFLDNHLPDGYGVDFIRYVKEQFPATKIVMVTAHDTTEDRQMALKEGADTFISKPFSTTEIKSTLQRFL